MTHADARAMTAALSVLQRFAQLLIATAPGLVAGWLRWPLIPACIVMGVAAVPALIGWAAPRPHHFRGRIALAAELAG